MDTPLGEQTPHENSPINHTNMSTTLSQPTTVSRNTDPAPNPATKPLVVNDGTYDWQVVGQRDNADGTSVLTISVNGTFVSASSRGNTITASFSGKSASPTYLQVTATFVRPQDQGDWTVNVTSGGAAVQQSFIKGGGGAAAV